MRDHDPSSNSSNRSLHPPTSPATSPSYRAVNANHAAASLSPRPRAHCSASPPCARAPTQLATAPEAAGPASASLLLGLSGRRFVSATSPRFGGQTHPNPRRSELVLLLRKESRPFPSLSAPVSCSLRREIQPRPSLLPNASSRPAGWWCSLRTCASPCCLRRDVRAAAAEAMGGTEGPGHHHPNGHANGSVAEEKLDELRRQLGKADGDPLRIAGVGAGAWGSVFCALLQDAYGHLRDKAQVRIWRRPGRAVDRATAGHLFDVINAREDVLRRLIRRCAYLKYVEARLGDRTLYADEILRDGFCLNMIDTPLCPLKVVTNLQEAVWDADIVVNGLPSTDTREVFGEIGRYWKERITPPIIISLAKGIEASLDPLPRIITPTQMISNATGVPLENILYLGGPNIASEIYNKEYANARICGADKWRKPLAKFLRQPHFIVWDNSDLITHEVMGGLKNVYAIGAGMVAALTNESATSKSVYFALCTSEMIYITHLLEEEPEKLAGPLLADTYVTLLKGRNAWYGHKLAKGELTLEMGDSIKGKGTIQGVSAVEAFYELLSQDSLSVMHPEANRSVAPVEMCPILKALHRILIKRDRPADSILQAIRDETMYDPRERIEMAQGHSLYRPSLLGQPKGDVKA